MAKVKPDLLGADMEFPHVPVEEIPENAQALRNILAGQRAMEHFYSRLEASLGGESGFLCRLLRRDWEKQFLGLLAAGRKLLGELGAAPVEGEALPRPPEVDKVAARLRDAPLPQVLGALSAFASKSLIASLMVPWVSDLQEVFEHFKACLEAEDRHLALLDMMSGLVADEGGG